MMMMMIMMTIMMMTTTTMTTSVADEAATAIEAIATITPTMTILLVIKDDFVVIVKNDPECSSNAYRNSNEPSHQRGISERQTRHSQSSWTTKRQIGRRKLYPFLKFLINSVACLRRCPDNSSQDNSSWTIRRGQFVADNSSQNMILMLLGIFNVS